MMINKQSTNTFFETIFFQNLNLTKKTMEIPHQQSQVSKVNANEVSDNVLTMNKPKIKLSFSGQEAGFQKYMKELSDTEVKECESVEFHILPGSSTENNARSSSPATNAPERSAPKAQVTAPAYRRDEPISVPSYQRSSVSHSTSFSIIDLAYKCCFFCPEDCKSLMCLGACLLILIFWPFLCAILGCFYCYAKCQEGGGEGSIGSEMKCETFQLMRDFGRRVSLKKIKLTVMDPQLDQDKINCMKDFVEQSGTGEFEFTNLVFFCDNSLYKNFDSNIKPITNLRNLRYRIHWSKHKLTNML